VSQAEMAALDPVGMGVGASLPLCLCPPTLPLFRMLRILLARSFLPSIGRDSLSVLSRSLKRRLWLPTAGRSRRASR
jgi:hypothetical protein